MRQLHPNRLRFAAFSDRNPRWQPVKALADAVRADRKPVAGQSAADHGEGSLDLDHDLVGELSRGTRCHDGGAFLATYGSPVLQAMVGWRAGGRRARASSAISRARPRSDGEPISRSSSRSAAWPRR
jgi:hypothetical protein